MAFWSPGPAAPFDPTDLQAAIDAIAADVGTLQGTVEPIEVKTVSGGAISTYTFSSLGGAAVVRLELRWVKGASSASAVLIRPNGISTNQQTLYSQGDAGSTPGDLSFAGLVLALGNRGPGGAGDCTLGLSTGRQRTGTGLFGVGGDAVTPSQDRNCYSYLLWTDTSTAVTSLQVNCIDTGTLLASADMLDGTEIALYRVR